MTFKNIHDWEAAQILIHYRSVKENDWVEFDNTRGLTGMQEQLLDQMDKGDGALRATVTRPGTSIYPNLHCVVRVYGIFHGA